MHSTVVPIHILACVNAYSRQFEGNKDSDTPFGTDQRYNQQRLATVWHRWPTIYQILTLRSLIMQGVLPLAPPLRTLNLPDNETVSFIVNGAGGCLQVLTKLSSTKNDTGRATSSEEGRNKRWEMKAAHSPSSSVYCCESLCETLSPRGRHKKCCEVVLLAMALTAIVCICSLPIIVYFTVLVRVLIHCYIRESNM